MQSTDSEDREENMDCIFENMGKEETKLKSDHEDVIKNFFSENKVEYIELVEKAAEAVRLMYESTIYNFDLIIFDINMEKDDSINENDYQDKFVSVFSKNGVILPDKYNDFKKYAGVYLYMYLLNIGYPKERILCLTGNTKINAPKKFQEKSLKAIVRDKGDDKSDWLEKDYYEKKEFEYYKVRRLVYQACDYWKQSIEIKEEIPFNKIINKGSSIPKESFLLLLDLMKRLFPVMRSQNEEKLYYQALKEFAIYHEDKANGYRNKKDKSKKYHQIMHLFRNWTAHNKFVENKLTANEFSLLFCIFLRVYFGEFEQQNLYYEKVYFNNINYHKYAISTETLIKDIQEKINESKKTTEKFLEYMENDDVFSNIIENQLGWQKTVDVCDVFYAFFESKPPDSDRSNNTPSKGEVKLTKQGDNYKITAEKVELNKEKYLQNIQYKKETNSKKYTYARTMTFPDFNTVYSTEFDHFCYHMISYIIKKDTKK